MPAMKLRNLCTALNSGSPVRPNVLPTMSCNTHEESGELLLHKETDGLPTWHSSRPKRSSTRVLASQYWWAILLIVTLAISVTLNVRTLGRLHSLEAASSPHSSFSNLQYHVVKHIEDDNDYLHDTPLAADLWRNISLQGLAVALSTETVQRLQLEPSQPFPWDTDRHLYYLNSFHQLHCLKLLRHGLIGLFNNGSTEIEKNHLLHCVDAFRQYVLCEADDTLLPLNPGSHLGAGKQMICKDWNELQTWATQDEFDSCWDIEDDYRPVAHYLERYSHCSPTSRYRPIQERYFQLHGHKPTFKDEQ